MTTTYRIEIPGRCIPMGLYADLDSARAAACQLLGWEDAAEMGGRDGTVTLAQIDDSGMPAFGSPGATIHEVTASVSDVSAQTDGHGGIVVTALVTLPGVSQRYTRWQARPHHVGTGQHPCGPVDGLEPAGDSVDAWTDAQLARVLPSDALVTLGLEVLAVAGKAVRS